MEDADQEHLTEQVMAKWEIIINRIKNLISERGKEMVLINIEVRKNLKEQFEMYQKTCEMVKANFEMVVSTGLPGEERIFWPNLDIQFYIREG